MSEPRTLPPLFESSLSIYGPDIAQKLIDSLRNSDSSTSIRANTSKGAKINGNRVPWLHDGIYLPERPVFALDPAWHQGLYYVQDASSMALTSIIKKIADTHFDNNALRVLDACAAPGGKSIAILEALPQNSFLLSNEYDSRRARILVENITKYGAANIAISQGDTALFRRLDEEFDLIVVDAPCSGEGMMRKEPEAIAQWNEGLVNSCAELQKEILANCWKALKPGGVLIYSTCTFNISEDENNLQYLVDELGGTPIKLAIKDFPGAVGSNSNLPCLHFLPGLVDGEGLFISAVTKPGDYKPTIADPAPRKQKESAAKNFIAQHMRTPYEYLGNECNGIGRAIPRAHAIFAARLERELKLLRNGLPLYTTKGKDIIPSWELSMCNALISNSFATIATDKLGALQYLHGESLSDIPEGTPKGFVLMTYNDIPLGFIKNIGRRANNLFPDEYRLRLNPTIDTLPHPTVNI